MKQWVCILLFWLVPAVSIPAEIKVFTTGNLKPILMETARLHETKNPGEKIVLDTGSITDTAAKLKAGASGDLLLAEDRLIQEAKENGAIDSDSAIVLFSNPVVAIADEASDIDWKDPKDITPDTLKKVALVSEKSPFGKRVRAYSKDLGLTEAVAEKKVEVKNTKAAVEAVKAGEAKWTFLYATDASRRKVKLLFRVPSTGIPEASFSVVFLKACKQKELAGKFVETLQSTIAQKFFENAGYVWKPGGK